MALEIGTILRHYKRPEIQQEMVSAARSREVAVKYGDKGFGKRPDILSYPRDVLEFAKQGVSSFHVSEEHWENPLSLSPELKKEEIDELRSGWDLVIDIDSPEFRLSKIIAWLIIKALREHGISSLSIKFSGNKGFHIGVPFEAFPKSIKKVRDDKIVDQEIRLWFPDGPKRIAAYLIDYISRKHIEVKENNDVVLGKRFRATFGRLKEMTKKTEEELTLIRCQKCKSRIQKLPKASIEFVCPSCSHREESGAEYLKCSKCGMLMDRFETKKPACTCGSDDYEVRISPNEIMDIDTLLISSRHMYRMPYSLHEKSGLCSLPFNPDDVLDFERIMGNPDSVVVSGFRFLDPEKATENEAAELLLQAFDFYIPEDEIMEKYSSDSPSAGAERDFEELANAVPKDFFPPCINRILSGLEDGRKRAMFILMNFLKCTGYEPDTIEKMLYDWNRNNKEELREVLIKGHARHSRLIRKKVLPPNCNNKAYYQDLHICSPDTFCPRIKNPVNYAILKAKIAQGMGEKGKREKLSDEQKEMRRKHREKMKKEKKQEDA